MLKGLKAKKEVRNYARNKGIRVFMCHRCDVLTLKDCIRCLHGIAL